ncbi:MAG: ABC transporter ATP-binding protein [Ignavibacteriaceae bacterium]
MENVVEIKNLTHYYGKKLVYENLNFNIKRGSVFGLLGKNGTGKTTTINILNGYLKPTSGSCLMFGEDSYKLSPATKARVGFLIEGHVQYNFMTIKQIEKFYSAFYPKWKREPYYELMSKLQVTEDQKISRMSCGQRSQVALGLLLAQDTDLLILDDYSMGLDAGYRRLFLDYLVDYTKGEGKTIFITSHIIQDLENFLEDCLIMDYRSVLLNMPIKKFQSEFKCFRFKTEIPNLKIEKNGLVKNFELIRDTANLFTFSTEEDVITFLAKNNIQYSALQRVSLTLEDAFVGITGKY